MIWILFAIITALFASIQNVFSKKNLKEMDEYVVAWSLRFFALPFLIPLLFFIEIPTINTKFWIALFFGLISVILTTILYMKAIKHSDLSLTVPLLTFTPLFLLITSPLIVGEFPTFFGLIGILLIFIGSYVLNIKERHKGYLAPIKALLKEKGPRLMLIVAFIWSIGSNIDKIGVQNSSPIFWVITINIFAAIIMFPIMLYKSSKNLKQIITYSKFLLPVGIFSGLGSIAQMIAINLTLVAYVISIKRTGVALTVLFGWLIFKEKGIKERITGVTIMIIGVLFMTLLS